MIMKHNYGVLISLISLFVLNVSHGFTFDSINLFSSSSSLSTREILPDTGYWEYIKILGLWGRLLHYLLTDTEAFGYHIKYLDRHYKTTFSPVRFVKLEQDVVRALPKFLVLHKLNQIKERIQDVRDDKTGKTLKDAIDIFMKLDESEECEEKFSERLHLVAVDQPAGPVITADMIKKAIITNPSNFADVFRDPQIIGYISGLFVQYIPNLDLVKGVQALQNTIDHLESVYPDIYKEKIQPLINIQDSDSRKTLGESLTIITNIVKSDEFNAAVKELMTDEAIKHIHAKSQDIIPKFVRGENFVENFASEASSSGNIIQDESSAPAETTDNPVKELVDVLQLLDINISEEQASLALKLAKKGELEKEVETFLNGIVENDGSVTAKTISEKLKKDNVFLSENQIRDIVDIIIAINPDDIAPRMKQLGIKIPADEIVNLLKVLQKFIAQHPSLKQQPISEPKPPQKPDNDDWSDLLSEAQQDLSDIQKDMQ